ncbi:MAG: SGNH/GDSL hydrolase family protein [Gemmatimonadota bacterium]|nr:MAG: SGNH/GDSL hydrolase family protein [Gemmatimonadota bacterium]
MKRLSLSVVLLFGVFVMLSLGACQDGENGGASMATPSPSPSPSPSPTSTVAASPEAAAAPVYVALGDSLAEGVGASDPSSTAYVPKFHEYLQDALGITDLTLMNLGHSGDTSVDLIEHGHLAEAVREIGARNFDEIPENDVQVVTLNIGGNDLLDLFLDLVIAGTCPELETSMAKPECVDALQDALDGLRENFDQALDELEHADPDLPILTADLYNPFSGSNLPFDEVAEWALEGREGSPVEEGMNDVIRSIAAEHGVPVADWYSTFQGKSAQFVASDRIHANDAGYTAMTDALAAAYEAAGG